jgi:hypothetical protein
LCYIDIELGSLENDGKKSKDCSEKKNGENGHMEVEHTEEVYVLVELLSILTLLLWLLTFVALKLKILIIIFYIVRCFLLQDWNCSPLLLIFLLTDGMLVSYAYLLSGLSPHVRYAYFGQEFLSSKLANHSFTHENCGAW